MPVCQMANVDSMSTNHTDEAVPGSDAAVAEAEENAQEENDSDEDSEDDDDIQVTIGDIKTTYELVLTFDV